PVLESQPSSSIAPKRQDLASSTPTVYDTRRPRTSSPPAAAWLSPKNYSATRTWPPPACMPESIWVHCEHWPCHSGPCRDEFASRTRHLLGATTQPGIRTQNYRVSPAPVLQLAADTGQDSRVHDRRRSHV